MEELIDLIVSDESASGISDKIKDLLFVKASEKVDSVKPEIAASFFNSDD